MDELIKTITKAQEIKDNMRCSLNTPSNHAGNNKFGTLAHSISELCDLIDTIIIKLESIQKTSNKNIVVSEPRHGYWTGRLSIDDSHSEGFSSNMSEEEKEKIRENNKHVTHCSVCGGMFDDRKIIGWKGCPYCLSILDLHRPENARYMAWEEYRKQSKIYKDNEIEMEYKGDKIL